MAVYTGDGTTTVGLIGVTAMSGTIDAGSANINKLVHFSITDMTPFFPDGEGGGGDGNAYITLDSTIGDGDPPDGVLRIFTANDQGIELLADADGVDQDDFSWAGAIGASVATDPTITINYTEAASDPPQWPRTGISLGVGL
jgi:hypothetical protein